MDGQKRRAGIPSGLILFTVRVIKGVCILFALYALGIGIVLKFFLSDLVFKKIEERSTHESLRVLVKYREDEALIRVYPADAEKGCAFYFPGQGGGIPRYETDVFQHAVARGVSIYAISYPGYEGAVGKASYESVVKTAELAVSYVNDNTSCRIKDSVFIGRSLGSVIALRVATTMQPKALLLDSTATSLSVVVRSKMKHVPFLKPALLLPVAKLMAFNPEMEEAVVKLSGTPIVIFQGERDALTPFAGIERYALTQEGIELIMVKNATHNTTQVKAGDLYFTKLLALLGAPIRRP